jgi:hypothetical protein
MYYTYLCVFKVQETIMAETVNFTGSVDRELLKRVKIIAAKSDTSINALFNAELRYLVETFEAAERTGNQNFKTLLDFSLGRVGDEEALAALGIDSQEDLFLLMAQAFADAEGCRSANPSYGGEPTRTHPLIGLKMTSTTNDILSADVVRSHEVTRTQTPSSEKLSQWFTVNRISIRSTKIFAHYQRALSTESVAPRKSNLGELAIQETMNTFALEVPPKTGVFLFEDHKIARASFVLPDLCRKVATRAFLIFLEEKGWIDSAVEIERKAIHAGRVFSKLRFR